MRPAVLAALLAFASANSAVDVAPAPREKAAVDPNPKEAPKWRLPGEAGVGRLVPDAAFADLAGKAGRLSDFKKSELPVVAFTNTTCPVCKKYAPSLRRIGEEFADKGVSLLFANATRTDDPREHGFAGRYAHDKEGVLTAALGATSTAEVFVLDAARTVRYRGAGDFKFPKGGVAIPAQFTELFKKYDANGDGKLGGKEFDALPPAMKRVVRGYVERGVP
jgi:thiol-disulfide isomerase/thioredoxin